MIPRMPSMMDLEMWKQHLFAMLREAEEVRLAK